MRVREETGRETEEMGKHRKREEQNKHITVNTDSSTTEQKQTHIAQFCCVYFSYPFIKLYIDYH